MAFLNKKMRNNIKILNILIINLGKKKINFIFFSFEELIQRSIFTFLGDFILLKLTFT